MQLVSTRGIASAAALLAASLAPAMAARDGLEDTLPARLEMSFDGPTLVTQAGMALYTHSNENSSSEKFAWQCTRNPPATLDDNVSGVGVRPQIGFRLVKSCVQKFPPYLADANARPVGDFSVVRRPEGTSQWAYQGFPLYTSIKDRKPGDRNGAFGGGGLGGGRAGTFRLAWMAMEMPTGFKFTRREEGLVLASGAAGERLLYTPRGGNHVRLVGVGGEPFQAFVAPAIAHVSGEWSIVDAGAGVKQYAYRGKPLYLAPPGTSEQAVVDAGGWELVVVQKGPGRPDAFGKQLTLLGEVYTNRAGMTLYTYVCNAGSGAGLPPRFIPVSCDDAGDPAMFLAPVCGGGMECARRWRPYFAPANAKPEGEFSIVDITYPMFTDVRGLLYPADAPRARVWAYRSKPLFTYYEDEKPGDIWGNNVGGLWGSSFTALEVPGRSAVSFEF